MATRLR